MFQVHTNDIGKEIKTITLMLFYLFLAPAPGVAVDNFTSPMTQIQVPWCLLTAVFLR